MTVYWFFPSMLSEPPSPTGEAGKPNRRHSAPASLGFTSKPAIPVLVSSMVLPSSSEVASRRRVYFLEPPSRRSSRSSTSRRHVTPAPAPASPLEDSQPSIAEDVSIPQIPEDVSPRSSSSTLVHVPTVLPAAQHASPLETCKEAAESDASSSTSSFGFSRPKLSPTRGSSFLSVVLPKGFKKGKRENKSAVAGADLSVDQSSPVSSSSKNKPEPGTSRPPSPSPRSSCDRPSSSSGRPSSSSGSGTIGSGSLAYLNLIRVSGPEKQQRRASIPRTQPYAYPYFAEPPTPASSGQPEKSESQPSETQVLSKREMNAKTQASLGIGRKAPPRRAATMSAVAG